MFNCYSALIIFCSHGQFSFICTFVIYFLFFYLSGSGVARASFAAILAQGDGGAQLRENPDDITLFGCYALGSCASRAPRTGVCERALGPPTGVKTEPTGRLRALKTCPRAAHGR